MKPYKTIINIIPVVAGLILVGWFMGCQESSVSPAEENPWLSEIKQMKRMVGEGHNYVVDQLMKNTENGLDLDVLKAETERFFRSKNMEAEFPSRFLTEIDMLIGPDNKPTANLRKLAQTQTAVGLLDSLLSETEADISEEWQYHFWNLAERMDAGQDFDAYIESAQVEDTSLMAHMWFADGIYDSSEAYWSSSLPRTTLNQTSALIPAWVILDVGFGALATAANCAFHPDDCERLSQIALQFIVWGATASVGNSLTRVLFP